MKASILSFHIITSCLCACYGESLKNTEISNQASYQEYISIVLAKKNVYWIYPLDTNWSQFEFHCLTEIEIDAVLEEMNKSIFDKYADRFKWAEISLKEYKTLTPGFLVFSSDDNKEIHGFRLRSNRSNLKAFGLIDVIEFDSAKKTFSWNSLTSKILYNGIIWPNNPSDLFKKFKK